jgi:hypothetical protein
VIQNFAQYCQDAGICASGYYTFWKNNHVFMLRSQRLEDMDRDGVDVQIISNTPILFQYHRPVEQVHGVIVFVWIDSTHV